MQVHLQPDTLCLCGHALGLHTDPRGQAERCRGQTWWEPRGPAAGYWQPCLCQVYRLPEALAHLLTAIMAAVEKGWRGRPGEPWPQ